MAGTPVRRAPYKDALQPALHRRFSSTAILLLGASYIEALFLADWSSYLWSWFPIGPAGFRTVLIFSCGLSILILRIAHYHVGIKTSESGLQTLSSSLLSLPTYETAFWYGVSSVVFCPIFLLSMGESSNLQWITRFTGDRARLNERPLFLACYLLVCSGVQTFKHFRLDIDRLDFGLSRPSVQAKSAKLSVLPQSFQTVLALFPGVLAGCAQQAIGALLLNLVVYYVFLRSFAWGWALSFLRPFYSLPKTSILPQSWPSDVYLLVRCIYAGTLLSFLWAAGNTAFSVFMVRRPMKNDMPLTSESKDPNGSLLNGLKSKKMSIKAFAMWELTLIAENFEVRRQAIFADIDRKDGPMWSQVYGICMELLKQMESRVDAYGKPPAAAVQPAPEAVATRQRSSAPLRQDEIFTKAPQSPGLLGGVEKAWDQIARAPGSSPVSELSPLAKKTWKGAKDRMFTKEQQEALRPDHLRSELGSWTASLMKVGWVSALCRQDFRSRFAGLVMGFPYAEPTLYANAAQALCQLSVSSLAEDQFGNVHRDVPSIIRTVTSVIRKVEALKERFPLHWTDPSGSRESPEVDQILDAMRTGLEQVVSKFEPYSADLRLSLGDIRQAKEATIKPVKPVKVEEPPKAVEAAKATKKLEERKRSEQGRLHRREARRVEMQQVR